MSKAGYTVETREIINITKLNKDGRTTIPAAICKDLGLKPGFSRVAWVKDGDRYCVETSIEPRKR